MKVTSTYNSDSQNEKIATINAKPSYFSDLIGFDVLNSLCVDAILLLLVKALRMYCFGFLSVMLVIYLSELNFSADKIGLLFTLTLVGDAIITIYLTTHSNQFGRKNTLLVGIILAIATSVTFLTQSNFWILVISAVFGVISPSGNEIGPFMAIEMSALAEVTPGSHRTKLMAWYNLFSCFSSATGALTAGFIINFLTTASISSHSSTPANGTYSYLEACRFVLGLYVIVQCVLFGFVLFLSPAIEPPVIVNSTTSTTASFLGIHKSKWIVLKLCLLFMIDSFAGSFVLQSIVSNWFKTVYHTAPTLIGTMVFTCNIVAGISALFAAKLSAQFGQILTMVFTHLPSNVFIILIPLMPNETLAIVCLCVRYSISQMDVPVRNAYVQDVVDPDERSSANGVTNVVRSIGGSIGPFIAGYLYANPVTISYPFYIAGGLKIIYDLLLLYYMQSTVPNTATKVTDAEKKPLLESIEKGGH